MFNKFCRLFIRNLFCVWLYKDKIRISVVIFWIIILLAYYKLPWTGIQERIFFELVQQRKISTIVMQLIQSENVSSSKICTHITTSFTSRQGFAGKICYFCRAVWTAALSNNEEPRTAVSLCIKRCNLDITSYSSKTDAKRLLLKQSGPFLWFSNARGNWSAACVRSLILTLQPAIARS